jgi:hypothetical protein
MILDIRCRKPHPAKKKKRRKGLRPFPQVTRSNHPTTERRPRANADGKERNNKTRSLLEQTTGLRRRRRKKIHKHGAKMLQMQFSPSLYTLRTPI